MKKLFFLIITSLLTIGVFAQQAYYNDVDLSLTGMDLKTELASKITSTHSHTLSYNDAREALKIVDLVPSQGTYVYLVYGFSNDVCPSSPGNDNDHKRRNKSDFGGGASCEWNREHTYPKSLGTPNLGSSGPGADAHMLRACDVQRNGERGSKKFKDGSGNSHTVSSSYWYPGDEWKGDMARMMMYMYLRYGTRCKPINVGYGSSISGDSYMINLFLDWNAEDPVSDYEKNRNTYLENASNNYGQGNRNPFIDNPYLATRIWGGQAAEDIWDIYVGVNELINDSQVITYPNPSNNLVYLKGLNDYTVNNLSLHTFTGIKVLSIDAFKANNLNVSNLEQGMYVISIETTKGIIRKKILIKRN